jgi:prepilin-type N-terminal cleavage/methylation domain-containing protein
MTMRAATKAQGHAGTNGADAIRRHAPGCHAPRAFTLTELLIVVGIIVLVATIAVPSFRAMTGGRSTEAAHNQLSAVMGRARLEAMGLQEVRGVMFYRDPQTQRVAAVLVKQTTPPVDPPPLAANQVAPEVYLDLVPDRDTMLLSSGVNLHILDDPGSFATDRYIGFNTAGSSLPNDAGPTAVPYGGVILFDGMGRLVSLHYALRLQVDPDGTIGAGPSEPAVPTEMARFLYDAPAFGPDSAPERQSLIRNPTPRSQFGFVVFEDELFKENGYTDGDPQVDPSLGSYNAGEQAEEAWIDENGVPQLVNRYNGTLLRGE